MPLLQFKPCVVALVVFAGCSGRPERFKAPAVDHDEAAAQAIELYDTNGDGGLSTDELKQCPAILAKLTTYDRNGNGSVEEDEIAAHLKQLLNGTGGTQLSALVTLKGKPLSGANVIMEPEPYLGADVQAAKGVTDGSGSTQLAIPPEFVPEHVRRISAVHYGTFKVRITHPSVAIPGKYNTETELGYETEIGKPT
nr:EF-hand domain-containing protein [Pirellulales bacterium]